MSPTLKLWIDRCGRLPPRHFWSTLILFMHYAWLQAVHAAKRERPGGSLESHINLKRTHYLEKTMLCGSDRTEELDFIYKNLKAYVESPAGPEDDCYLYMVKMLQEYECYPDKFTCYMHGVSSKPYSEIEPKVLRRIIVQRRSIRRFQDRPIEDDKLKQIAESASFAPTSCNAQPLIVITLTKPEIVHQVFQGARGAEDWAKAVPSGIVIAADRRHYKPFDQHIVMFQDIASALQNCLLTCEALNLAACWVSLISDVHMNNQEDLHRLLGLPDNYVVGGAIAVGYPANMVCHVPRRPLTKVWHKELFVESAPSHAGRR